MQPFQERFIELAMRRHALRFGQFTLKSGRISPYFFDIARLNCGADLRILGACYAAALSATGFKPDMLFGPAYKGIPLVIALAIALADEQGQNLPYAFNRKEIKGHGEGGQVVGAPLQGEVLIVDDVITAGTAVRESLSLIRAAGATPKALLVALDRQEQAPTGGVAAQALANEHGLEVAAIVCLDDLLRYLVGHACLPEADLAALHAYRDRYGTG